MVHLCIVIYILCQNLHSLTCAKNYAQHKKCSREYMCTHLNYD
jgi:hypothetical protein